jgi:glycosyltransferase involved in cell wall biosynthesis
MATPRADPSTSISVVCTVLNEAATIDQLVTSLTAQTRQPEQIVIVDGGSTDGTWETLKSWQSRGVLVAISRSGANISRGRNEAIRAANSELIAVTDAGVRLDPGWLAALVARFEREHPPPDVVGGFFEADPGTLFELALGVTTLPTVDEIKPAQFLPSSRSVAFLKEAWQEVGGYPEWLDYCEDLVFDLALRRAGRRFAWAPSAVAHFRPRASPWLFFMQYYRYARGDGKALLWTRRHVVRYATYLGTPVVLRRTGIHPAVVGLITLGGTLYCARPVMRLFSRSDTRPRDQWRALPLVPFIRLIGDVAKMLGYPVGLAWRVRHSSRLA